MTFLLIVNAFLVLLIQSIDTFAIANSIDCQSDIVHESTESIHTVSWPLSPFLAIGDRVTLREKNKLNGLWTVSTLNGSTVIAASMHFSAFDKHIVMPTHPRGSDVGCTAIVYSQGNARRGVARFVVQRLSGNDLIASVVLINVNSDENAQFDRDFEIL
jgi:hypothetical protein